MFRLTVSVLLCGHNIYLINIFDQFLGGGGEEWVGILGGWEKLKKFKLFKFCYYNFHVIGCSAVLPGTFWNSYHLYR